MSGTISAPQSPGEKGTIGAPGAAPPEALATRDRLLAALLKDHAAVLFQRDDVLVRLQLSTGEEIALVCPQDLPGFGSQLDSLISAKKAGTMHVVAVGGSPDVRPVMRQRCPIWQITRQFGFFHLELSPELTLKRVAGARSRHLKRAVDEIPSIAPVTDDRIASSLTQGAQHRAEEA